MIRLPVTLKTTPRMNARVNVRCWLAAISTYCVTLLTKPIGTLQMIT